METLFYLWVMNDTNTHTVTHANTIRIALSRTTSAQAIDAWVMQAINGATTEKNAAVLDAKLHTARYGCQLRNLAPMTASEKRSLTAAMKVFGL